MKKIPVRILGSGEYLPSQCVSSEELEKELGYKEGTIAKTSGVNTRYRVTTETSSDMGKIAAEKALESAKIDKEMIDAVISVSAVPEQSLPSTAALIHEKLKLQRGVAFDINATCLSFLTGLLCASNLIATNQYRHILLVSSEIASCGLNPDDPKTASLFGDGAAAIVIGPSLNEEGILAYQFETKSNHARACECQVGGTLDGAKAKIANEHRYFHMNGRELIKASLPSLTTIVSHLQKIVETIDYYIPHQASPFALDFVQKRLNIPRDRFMNIVKDYGNMIAASIPFALHRAITEKKIQRGDKVCLLGTGAGLTIGGMILEY